VQLAKAMAVGFAATGQVDAYPDNKEEQRERSYSTPKSRGGGYQGDGHGQLGKRQQDAERSCERGWQAKVDDGLPGTRAVRELGYPGYGEDHHEYQSCNHQSSGHSPPNLPRASRISNQQTL
jgi:hypothetical protein